MKYLCTTMMLAAVTFCDTTTTIGQEIDVPKPGPELDVFKPDVGIWNVEIKTWAAPGEPTVTSGKETNRMLGDYWLLVDFQGNMMGLDFEGHGAYTYDTEKKQYVGTWIDSMSPRKMDMIGVYDKDNQTMTYQGMAPGADGKLAKHVLTTKYKEDGTRVLTMHMQAGETMLKFFEMNYTKAKAPDASGSNARD